MVTTSDGWETGPDHAWTADELRQWADYLANRIERSEAELRVDLDHHDPGSNDFIFKVRRTP